MLHVCPAWSGDALLGWEYSVWGDAHLEAVSKGSSVGFRVQVGAHVKA